MLRETLCLLLLGGLASSITCPDGKFCPDVNSCCRTKQGYSCCPYPRVGTRKNESRRTRKPPGWVWKWKKLLLPLFCPLYLVYRQPCFFFLFLYCARPCAAPTWPTAALRATLATWPRWCARRWASRGGESPWCGGRRLQLPSSLWPPVWSSRRAWRRARARWSTATTPTTVPIAPPAADTPKAPGSAADTPLWVHPEHREVFFYRVIRREKGCGLRVKY